MFTVESARELLTQAGVFFRRCDDDDGLEWDQTLNMNDVWCWGCADDEYVSDEDLPELARLFFFYGWAGVLYWVSYKRGGMRSEFHDNNRFIDFAKNEEKFRKSETNSSSRAYKKISYTLGET